MRIPVLAILLACLLLAGFAAPAQADRLTDFDKLFISGKTAEALSVMRQEFADRNFSRSPPPRAVYARQRMLLVLGRLITIVGVKPDIEAEARKHYEDGLAIARDNGDLQAYMHNGMALYYSYSQRNGLAVPFLRKEGAHWERAGNTFRLFLVSDALSKAYTDAGEFDLWRHQLTRTLDLADRYFVVGSRPSSKLEWLQYYNGLLAYMDVAAQTGDRALMEKLYARFAPIGVRVFNTPSETPLMASAKFGVAGDVDRARALVAESKALTAKEGTSAKFVADREWQVACAEGQIEVVAKNYPPAVALLDRCIAESLRFPVKVPLLMRARGRAHEGAGEAEKALADYRAAIAYSEGVRDSYSIAERAKFFGTVMREAYWGMTRVQARRAAGDEAAFFEAMATAELVRGRQLGELVDPEMAKRLSPEGLKALQKRLPADAVVLAYTATGDTIVLLGLARDRVLARLIPYDSKAFGELVRGIAAELADPEAAKRSGASRTLVIGRTQALPPASPKDLDARLLEMSRILLSPAREFIAGKKRIIALPDGVMNTVPFELLSAAADAYRPLVVEHTVSASPSLAFIQYAERQRRAGSGDLFAVADPKYVKPQMLAGASLEEVQAATRGSRYLQYFQPLPETRTEAQAIAKMFAGQKTEVLLGEFALESEIKKRDLASYSFLHFATHGILGGEVPGVGEPALVLGEEPGEDGFLTASEVSKLRLNAQLTVLSACNTGSGEFVTGEGVMGMSRAFLAAGSLSVVVSLWPVHSEFTERLMVEFYRQLRAGQPAPEALRAAKLELISRANKAGSSESHPFYWAPFILLGG